MLRGENVRDRVSSMDHREMGDEEAVFKISNVIGFNGTDMDRVRRRDLNSIYWYVTGEMFAPMIDFGSERSPCPFELRKAVAEAGGFHYNPNDEAEQPRPYRQQELQAIVHKLRNTPDSR